MADLSVEFLPEAQQELADAYDWYEERRPGLGEQLLLSVEAVLDAIQRHPESGTLVHRVVRRLLTRRFPYSVLYVVDNARLVVIAIYHGHREPHGWADRI